jgi:hypothetical protein
MRVTSLSSHRFLEVPRPARPGQARASPATRSGPLNGCRNMADAPVMSTQRLAEFLAAVSGFRDEPPGGGPCHTLVTALDHPEGGRPAGGPPRPRVR